MDVQVLNGTSRINGANPYAGVYMNGDTARINGTSRINGVTKSELVEYYISRAMGDQTALNGTPIGFLKKWKARREEKKAVRQDKKAGKKDARAERKALRARKRIARTEQLEKGEGFFQKAAGALSNFGEASKIRAQAEQMALADGVQLDFSPSDVEMIARDAVDFQQEANPSFWQQYKTPIMVAGGLTLAGIAYAVLKPKKKTRGRRR